MKYTYNWLHCTLTEKMQHKNQLELSRTISSLYYQRPIQIPQSTNATNYSLNA